jgi:glycogen(starch) synthase
VARVLMLVWTGVATDTRVRREATALAEAGHRVHIIGRAVPAGFHPDPGVTVSTVGAGPRAASRSRPLTPANRAARWLMLEPYVRRRMAAWRAAAYIESLQHEADIVHAHDLSALPVGARLARRWQVPLVYDSHELWSGRPMEGARWPGLAQADEHLERDLGAQASAVVTVGDGLADALRTRYRWAHLRVVRNSFPLRASVPALPAAPTGLVYAGRLAAARELEVIAAASQLVDLPITALGPADAQWLAGFKPGRVEVLPAEDLDLVDARLSRAGLALVTHSNRWPNHRLALPNKLFHASSLGVPVVATDVGELAAIVAGCKLGTLYRPGDPRSLASAIERARADYPRLRAAAERARPALSWERDRDALLGTYAEVLAEARS